MNTNLLSSFRSCLFHPLCFLLSSKNYQSPSVSHPCPCFFGDPGSDSPFLSTTCFQGRRSWIRVLNLLSSVPGRNSQWSDCHRNLFLCGAYTGPPCSLGIDSLTPSPGEFPCFALVGECLIFQMDSFFSGGFLIGPRVSVSLGKPLQKLLL